MLGLCWPLGAGDLGERRGEWALTAPLLAPVPVADMKMLLMGKECPHTKEKSSGKQNKVSISHPASCRGPSMLSSPTADGFWWWVDSGKLGGFMDGGRFFKWLETFWVSRRAEEEAERQLLL